MKTSVIHRLLLVLAAAFLLPAVAFALTATPSTTEGPYYPFNSGQTLATAWITGEAADNDLTHIYSTSTQCNGSIMLLSGTLVDSNGTTIPGASIELWEADSGGVYYYIASTNAYSSRDTNFQPFGATTTDASGAWSFRCIKPGKYTGRIRHFHFKVKIGGVEKLTSQFMFSEDSASFSSDGVAAPLVSAGTMSLVTLTPTTGTDTSGNSVLIATKQIVLSGTYSTSTTVAPAITTQPSSITITAGNNATFSIVASSTAALSYQWYKGTAAISGATSSSYTITSATTSAAGSYYVVVTNSAGSVTSSTVTLTVNAAATAPAITTQPASVTVTAGNSATFSVVATGTATLSYQWYKGTAAISGGTSSSYTIASTATSDAGSYYVVVTNSAGSATSGTGTLTVNAAVTTTAPAITTQPASITVTAGNSATFSVVATGTATPSYQWYKGSTAISAGTSSSYTTASTTTSDAGSYYVVITNSAGSVTSNAATLTVNAAVTATAPAITTQPASITVTAGNSATFSVVATGTATLSYQWYKSGAAISGATSSAFAITAATTSSAGSYSVIVSNSAGSVTSGSATLTVNAAVVAPSISAPPASATITVGDSVTFAVTAAGTAPLTYQWRKDGTALAGASSATYTIASADLAAAGTYTVVVTNSAGSVTSAGATLTVNLLAATDTAPVILTQPSSITIAARASATFTVAATGTGPLSFQWRKDGAAISGATATIYSLASASTTDSGAYAVTVTNTAGSVTSAAATLTVTSAALVNLSVRSYLPSSNAVLTAGFVIQSSTGKRLLVRAVGPALSTFGVTNALSDPTLEIYDVSSAKTVENDNWSSSLSTTFAQLGAFGLPADSKDSALVVNLPAGAGTAQVRGSTAGVALVEAYDMASTSTSRLVNLSARAVVGTDPNTLIAGFVIQGTGSIRLLVRAVGPKLADFGVTGALADPKIVLYDSTGAKIAENDNWDASLAPVIAQAGGFALTLGSKDAAVLVTLPAGAGYTAVVSSADATTGEALVELYEIP